MLYEVITDVERQVKLPAQRDKLSEDLTLHFPAFFLFGQPVIKPDFANGIKAVAVPVNKGDELSCCIQVGMLWVQTCGWFELRMFFCQFQYRMSVGKRLPDTENCFDTGSSCVLQDLFPVSYNFV